MANHRSGTWGITAITLLNSLATGVLWNGLGFITADEFHYSPAQTYGLFIATGGVYAIAAYCCGRIVRRFEARLNPRGVMVVLFLIQAVVASFTYVGTSSAALITIAVVTSLTAACLWPIVESYIGAGKSPPDTRRAIGNWCIVWMTTVAVAMVLMAPLQRSDGWLTPQLAVFAITPLSLLSIGCLWFVPSHPAHHQVVAEAAPLHYKAQLQSARILLPASYLLVGALSPLMPYVLDRLELDAQSEPPLTATWLGMRVVIAALMARLAFWHGRWSTLLLGSVMLAGGFAMVMTLPSLAGIVVGLALFGAGQGVIYYAALYYALRVGSAQIDAGGMHEALIGLGYMLGPAAGLAGYMLGGGGWTVTIVCGTLALAAIPAALPWIRLRR